MCLRFVFLLTTRAASWLRLSRREETWKTAEILILRHQLAVLQRRRPRRPNLNWADRALLAALPGLIPKARRQGLGLLVTPDTIVRWHRDIVRRRWAARSMRGRTGRPSTRRNIRALARRLARENPDSGFRSDRALAPRHRPPPLGREVHARQDWPAVDPAEHPGPGPTASPREPRLGIPIGSCAGPATSSAAAGPRGPCAAGLAGRRPGGTSGPWPDG